jgi:hypothetical protein
MKYNAASLRTESRNTGINVIFLVYELTGSIYYHGRGNHNTEIISGRL